MNVIRPAPLRNILPALFVGGILVTAFIIPGIALGETGRPWLAALMFAPFWVLLLTFCFEWEEVQEE